MDCYKMHSCLLQSLPNDSHPTDSFLHQAKKKGAGGGAGGDSGNEKFPNRREIPASVLGFLQAKRDRHLEFHECFLLTVFEMPIGWQNVLKEENRKPVFLMIF